jgi:septum formation protein
LVLASSSEHRRRLLAAAGIVGRTVEPDVDEEPFHRRLGEWGAERLACELAAAKARSVEARPDEVVLAADQVGVLDGPVGPVLLTKPVSVDAAVAQLVAMSGRTHRLVNGVVVRRVETGDEWSEVDVHEVTMRDVDEATIRAYVERYRPLDSAGAYRIEDDDRPGAGLIASVQGGDRSGVVGLPLPVVRRLLALAGFDVDRSDDG